MISLIDRPHSTHRYNDPDTNPSNVMVAPGGLCAVQSINTEYLSYVP